MSVYYSRACGRNDRNVLPYADEKAFPETRDELDAFIDEFANWYHDNGGYEDSWPIKFWFFRDELGDGSPADLEVEVDREARPEFHTLSASWADKRE